MKKSTVLVFNRVKIGLAIIMLIADIIATAACIIDAFYAGIAIFFLLSYITLDYIRIARSELKAGLWYEMKKMDKK